MAGLGTKIEVMSGPDAGKAWELDTAQEYMVGRGVNNEIRLTDKTVSSIHARLEWQEGIWFVSDLGSRHGTYVQDEKVKGRKALFGGDIIRLGKTLIEFKEDEEADAASAGQ